MNDDDRKPDKADGAREARPTTRGDRDVGHALRSVYTETVSEEIPADILALLGKLD